MLHLLFQTHAYPHHSVLKKKKKVEKEKKKNLCHLWGSNSRPSDYETDALPTAPRRHLVASAFIKLNAVHNMYWLILVVIKVKKMIVWLHTPAYLLFHTHTHTHIRTHTLTHHHQGWYIYPLHQLCPGATTHCAMHESRGRVISVTLPYVPLPRQLLYHRLVHTVAKVGLPLVHPSSQWFFAGFTVLDWSSSEAHFHELDNALSMIWLTTWVAFHPGEEMNCSWLSWFEEPIHIIICASDLHDYVVS